MHAHFNVVEPGPDIPDGFKRIEIASPFMGLLGPIYIRRREEGNATVALRVSRQHLNLMGAAHGGMLTALADNAFGINIALARGRRGAHVTVSMTADFLSSAREGEWLEGHVLITRLGRQLAYANCDLKVGDRHVLRSSAVFKFVDRAAPLLDG